MICYKDKTFCDYYKTCADGDTCHRALTKDVRKRARKWWGRGIIPISVYAEHPECFKEKKK